MSTSPNQNINDIALKYMKQKYNEEFEYYAPFGNSMSGTHQLLVKCDSFPNQEILVQIENYKKEDKVFLDNYLAVKYHEDTVAFVSKCANQVFTEADVYSDIMPQVLSAALPATAMFEEYLADTRVPLQIFIEVKASNFASEDQIQELADLLGAYGSHFYLSVVISEDSKFGSENIDALDDKVVTGDFLRCADVMRFSDGVKVRWLKEE